MVVSPHGDETVISFGDHSGGPILDVFVLESRKDRQRSALPWHAGEDGGIDEKRDHMCRQRGGQ